MAGMDLGGSQHMVVLPHGLRLEAGYFDFSDGSQTVDVPTTLINVKFGMGISQDKLTGINQTLISTTDGDVTNSTITFRRGSNYLDEDLRTYYLLMGW